MKDACHEMRVSNYKVVNGCTLLDLSEEADGSSWIEAMGEDPVHLTEAGLMKLAASVLKISESTDSSFSGGKAGLRGGRRQVLPADPREEALGLWTSGVTGRWQGRPGQAGQPARTARWTARWTRQGSPWAADRRLQQLWRFRRL